MKTCACLSSGCCLFSSTSGSSPNVIDCNSCKKNGIHRVCATECAHKRGLKESSSGALSVCNLKACLQKCYIIDDGPSMNEMLNEDDNNNSDDGNNNDNAKADDDDNVTSESASKEEVIDVDSDEITFLEKQCHHMEPNHKKTASWWRHFWVCDLTKIQDAKIKREKHGKALCKLCYHDVMTKHGTASVSSHFQCRVLSSRHDDTICTRLCCASLF